MEFDSIDCMTSSDAIDDDEIHHRYQLSSLSKTHSNNENSNGNVSSAVHPSTTSVHELLEFPACTNSMYPPIHQRHSGHTLCSACKTRVHNRCPTWRQELGDVRCLALEKAIQLPICRIGGIPFLVAHLRDDRKVDMHSGCTFNNCFVKSNPLEVENATWMLTVFHCYGQYFCLHFEAFHLGLAPVYMAFLRFMGDKIEARNYG